VREITREAYGSIEYVDRSMCIENVRSIRTDHQSKAIYHVMQLNICLGKNGSGESADSSPGPWLERSFRQNFLLMRSSLQQSGNNNTRNNIALRLTT
jgi:hypothetical protein